MRTLLVISFALLLTACASTSTIHTQPLDADVYINGQHCRVSPCIYHSRYGFPDRMRVQIRSPGYEPVEFFVDTEAPMASYLLMGFGSYIFHGFDKEYRFEMKQLDASMAEASQKQLAKGVALEDDELTSVLEQCLYWSEQEAADVWTQRFFESAASFDCTMAKTAISLVRSQNGGPKPSLARALLRYLDYRVRKNLPSVALPWTTESLCNSAKVEYAKRVGAMKVIPDFPPFDRLCPKESKELRSE
ncbi:MAG: hypothetical protein OEX19_16905 [Gammaproteobacteria bacterium]|nr:hypothetical protein [Gammaproteobacteria bacterium]